MTTSHEAIVYIHGVSQDLDGASHADQYQAMNDGIRRVSPSWPASYLGIEWGWHPVVEAGYGHQRLAEAQKALGDRVMTAIHRSADWTINPGRIIADNLRRLLFYGMADAFYYVSEDGKRTIRNAIARRVAAFLQPRLADDGPVSLTLLGHSAGSVIAMDFLFFLFYPDEGRSHVYLPSGDPSEDDAMVLRRLAQAGRLRLRRLFTFGSPVTMLACRSNAVVDILAGGGRLDPRDYGLLSGFSAASALEGPRWLNVWDRDDPIAWPVEPLIARGTGGPCAEDVYIDVSDSISRSHTAYWQSSSVHRLIGQRW